jgi:hypothetical protein
MGSEKCFKSSSGNFSAPIFLPNDLGCLLFRPLSFFSAKLPWLEARTNPSAEKNEKG